MEGEWAIGWLEFGSDIGIDNAGKDCVQLSHAFRE
jgi:hypothetical protein